MYSIQEKPVCSGIFDYTIIEEDTQEVICVSQSKKKANTKLAFFNSGGGFAGWTPHYLMTRVKN